MPVSSGERCQYLRGFDEASANMAEWVKREYGKGAIDRAGRYLAEWWVSDGEDLDIDKWHDAFATVENWRACHGLPLNVIQAGLRGRIRRVKQEVSSTGFLGH